MTDTTGINPIAVFNYGAFVAQYPTFACLNELQAQGYFDMAGLYHRNDGFGPVKSAAQQTMLMYLVTAHLAALMTPQGQNGGAAPVGRISDASEGSVSASFDVGDMKFREAWFAQTQYGFSYWQATAAYRQMRYVPPIPRNFNPWPGQGGAGGTIIV